MKFYIDSDFCCHPENSAGTFRQMEHSFFDGKCSDFIKGYRYVPSGESWTRSDGTVFQGEMITPWKDCNQLDAIQRQYDRYLIGDMQTALEKMGVTLDE